MRHHASPWLPCLCVLALLVGGARAAAQAPELTIDSFADPGAAGPYRPYAQETVLTQEGYGIYFQRATVTVSRAELPDTTKALRIQYAVPPYFAWGNWVSIRKVFPTPLDVSQYSGLKLDLKVLTPSQARLRLTLADVATLADAHTHGKDELWWFDVPPVVVSNAQQHWITLQAPCRAFYRAYGAGTRDNDAKLALAKIVAYELNVLSKGQEYPQGEFLVKALQAYNAP